MIALDNDLLVVDDVYVLLNQILQILRIPILNINSYYYSDLSCVAVDDVYVLLNQIKLKRSDAKKNHFTTSWVQASTIERTRLITSNHVSLPIRGAGTTYGKSLMISSQSNY